MNAVELTGYARNSFAVSVGEILNRLINGNARYYMNNFKKSKARLLLEEYLSGSLSAELRKQVQEWIVEECEDEERDDALQDLFETFSKRYPKPSLYTLKAWNQRCRELGIVDKKGRRILLRKQMTRVAAVVLPILLFIGSVTVHNQLKSTSALTGIENYTAFAASDAKKKLELPCGTTVWLNAGTEIKYDENNYQHSRTVLMNGEAYFSVTHMENSPFTVRTEDLSVTVLGTEFNVKSSDTEAVSEISLFSGRVEVAANDRTVQLAPREQLIYNRETGVSEIHQFEFERVESWRTILSLDNVTLEDALLLIGQHYDVTLSYNRIPDGKMVRATFVNEDIDMVLSILRSISGGFDYKINGNDIEIIMTE